MIVSEFLGKHFPALVGHRFTADMETSLDKIARGEDNKINFLSKFYLGSSKTSDDKEHKASSDSKESGESAEVESLLPRVNRKLRDNEFDPVSSRCLEVNDVIFERENI